MGLKHTQRTFLHYRQISNGIELIVFPSETTQISIMKNDCMHISMKSIIQKEVGGAQAVWINHLLYSWPECQSTTANTRYLLLSLQCLPATENCWYWCILEKCYQFKKNSISLTQHRESQHSRMDQINTVFWGGQQIFFVHSPPFVDALSLALDSVNFLMKELVDVFIFKFKFRKKMLYAVKLLYLIYIFMIYYKHWIWWHILLFILKMCIPESGQKCWNSIRWIWIFHDKTLSDQPLGHLLLLISKVITAHNRHKNNANWLLSLYFWCTFFKKN